MSGETVQPAARPMTAWERAAQFCYDAVVSGTNEWQRVDNTGCMQVALRIFLLAWAVVLPYAVITRSFGWFGTAMACVLVGVWLTLRERQQRAFEIPEMLVDVSPSDLAPNEPFVVRLRIAGDKSRTIRWWSAELMASKGDEPKTMVSAEFAIDPEAGAAPVSELQMLLAAPGASVIAENDASEWWVQVTVQTERGRMESGRVGVTLRSS
jgi:hypothetical protein